MSEKDLKNPEPGMMVQTRHGHVLKVVKVEAEPYLARSQQHRYPPSDPRGHAKETVMVSYRTWYKGMPWSSFQSPIGYVDKKPLAVWRTQAGGGTLLPDDWTPPVPAKVPDQGALRTIGYIRDWAAKHTAARGGQVVTVREVLDDLCAELDRLEK